MLAECVKILLIEDNRDDAELLQRALTGVRAPIIDLLHIERLAQGIEILAAGGLDLVLLDLTLPDAAGTDTVIRIQTAAPHLPIVVLTGFDDEATALHAMKCGAQDYLVKGQVNRQLLLRAIRYAIERKRAEEDARQLLREQVARATAEDVARRSRLLAEVSRVLASSFDVKSTLGAAAKLTVPMFSDVCVVDIMSEGGGIQRVAVAHVDPDHAEVVEQLWRCPPDPRCEAHPVVRSMRTRAPVLLNDASEEMRLLLARDPEHPSLSCQPSMTSAIIIPLLARGRTLGTISCSRVAWRGRYSLEDIAFAEDFAGRAALSLDNARLYRAREDMMAIVSHDLRNPLNVIGLCAANLGREPSAPASRARFVETIRRSVSRMNGLIGDLLDMTRLDGGSLVLERSCHSPADLIRDADEALRVLAEEKSITFEHSLEEGLPGVLVDRERTLQVFSNLIGNAVKFTDQGGIVILGAARSSEGEVCFFVTDNGPGIRAEDLGRVFDRFWQAERTSRRGAGLGLNIAKGIVDAHGGRIWAESGFGQGSSFCFTLPIDGALALRA